jgi:large subunit ribosomal protein L6
MSRIGKQPIAIPDGVDIDISPGRVAVKGPRGELTQAVSREMKIDLADGTLTVSRPTDRGPHRALHGLTRSLVANMVEGVTNGYERRLEIQGVGYRARLQGRRLELSVGFSHPIAIEAPEGIEFEVPAPTRITVRGNDKQLVGEVAANIRKVRKPEPYKGKGVRYEGEYVRKKAGKAAKGAH